MVLGPFPSWPNAPSFHVFGKVPLPANFIQEKRLWRHGEMNPGVQKNMYRESYSPNKVQQVCNQYSTDHMDSSILHLR